MSEEDHEIDVDSDVPEVGGETTAGEVGQGLMLDKRAHHNELERRRRDHIKDSFHGLRDCIPSLRGEKVSRAHILNKATEYIRQMQKRSSSREEEIDDLREKNEVLEEQVQALERAKSMGTVENVEELLVAVAEKVRERQRQSHQQQQYHKINAVQSNRTDGSVAKENGNGKAVETVSPMTAAMLSNNKPNNSSPADVRTSKDNTAAGLSSPINLLASNLKTAQTLLTALSKNLPPGTSLPANVKTLAAKVLASPIRPPVTSVATTPVPRGIVTATTVPRGTVPVVHTQPPVVAKHQSGGGLAQTKSTPISSPTVFTRQQSSTPSPAAITTTPSSQTAPLTQATPNVLSQKAARDLHAQLVALQNSAGTQQLSPELLAQVHSLLNLSSSLVHNSSSNTDSGEEESTSVPSHTDSDAHLAVTQTSSPRSTSEPGMNVAVELAPVLSSPESTSSSTTGVKRAAIGGSIASKRLKMADS